ncbi:signal peptidase I [Fluviispira multicolorata]|uniref:Signal peptidase I n=1 Tax=Fluviispira multicolorata TaxID=2654512 RepID=A0A833JCP0_9BACT|nr:signal peptidase I [Fluviispira multicolorata]KAB8027433.1 signal peptidase I [Fluviispira multicolorata]
MKFFKEVKEILIILAIIIFFRSSLLNWYLIPSSSMLPTLKIGDHVLVNKLSYGFMFPFMEKRLVNWSNPQRGDIVVFQGPLREGGQTVMKRVVGIAGDTVSFTKGVLTINNIVSQESLELNRNVLEDIGGIEEPSEYNIFMESGFSKYPHQILRKKSGGLTVDEKKSWTVPEGKILCIGDNRDNSYDGRFWGYIDETSVYGRALFITYSTGEKGTWPHFRNERWFMKLTN